MSFRSTPSAAKRAFPFSSHAVGESRIRAELGIIFFIIEALIAHVARMGVIATMYPTIIFAWVVLVAFLLVLFHLLFLLLEDCDVLS